MAYILEFIKMNISTFSPKAIKGTTYHGKLNSFMFTKGNLKKTKRKGDYQFESELSISVFYVDIANKVLRGIEIMTLGNS